METKTIRKQSDDGFKNGKYTIHVLDKDSDGDYQLLQTVPPVGQVIIYFSKKQVAKLIVALQEIVDLPEGE